MLYRPRNNVQMETPKPVNEEHVPSSAVIDQTQVLGIDPMMLTSLPPMASGADVYVRQFYGNPLPARRYLPLKGA